MQSILRRHLLALMLGVTAATFTAPFLFDAPAFAKDGRGGDSSGSGSGDSDSDSSGSSGSGGGHSGSSGDSDGDDSGGDDSGRDGGSGDDDGTPDQGSGNNDDSDDDSVDDSDDDRDKNAEKAAKKAEKAARKAGREAARPTATITLSDESLANVRSGTHVVVDQLGRQLEITVRTVNGQTVISAKPHGGAAKRNPGPITTIDVVEVSSVPGDDDGTPDQGSGDN